MTAVVLLRDARVEKVRIEFRRRFYASGGRLIEISDLIDNAKYGSASYGEVLEALALFEPDEGRPFPGGDAA